MESEGISRWLDKAMEGEGVAGAVLVNSSTGLCLGARGVATEADATFLTVAARRSLDKRAIGAVAYRDFKVLLSQLDSGVLVAVFKERKAPEASDGS
ncbi:MAG: hypothetical protein M1839_003482 [Geoglossum umbratile]|nr:MAG: hypothetical protein M1839_003482 [Geoglossum umbratile]